MSTSTVLRGELIEDVLARLREWPDSCSVRISGRDVSLGTLRDMQAILQHVQQRQGI